MLYNLDYKRDNIGNITTLTFTRVEEPSNTEAAPQARKPMANVQSVYTAAVCDWS
jgi:hypothetical protein